MPPSIPRQRCSTGCGSTVVRPAPRRAAPRATAAPAPSCWPDGAEDGARLRAGQCLHPAPRTGRRRRAADGRGPRRSGDDLHPVQQAMVDPARLAVRLLHARHRDEPVRPLPGPRPARDARRRSTTARRQSLPLHRLPADRRRGARRPAASRPPTASARARAASLAPPRGLRRRPRPLRRRRRSASSPRPASEDCPRRPAATAIPTRCWSRGATDVGLWVTKALHDPARIIWLGRVAGLDAIEDGCRSGRVRRHGVARARRGGPRAASIADLGELMRRFGSIQVRVSGTVGGNIANGSPIGDLPPALIALGATWSCAMPAPPARLPLERLLHRLPQAGPTPGRIRPPGARAAAAAEPARSGPSRSPSGSTRTSPPSWRPSGSTLDGRTVAAARIAFGGMAATPKRAPPAEAALAGDRPRRRGGPGRPPLDALALDFAPLERPARQRRVPGARGPQPPAQGAGGTARRPAAATRIVAPGGRASCRRVTSITAPRRRRTRRSRPSASRSCTIRRGLHVQRRRHLHRRHPRARRDAAHRARPVARMRRGRVDAARPRRGAGRARRRRGAHRRRHPGQERHRAGLRRRPDVRRRRDLLPRPGGLRGRGRDARRGAPRGPARPHRGRGRDARWSPSTTRWPRDATVLPDYGFGRGDVAARAGGGAAAARRHVPDRRAGALLSRRPGGARDAGRGRRHARPFLDPAPDRGAAHRAPACSACPDAFVTVEIRRMGGGFGGKESQATPVGRDRGAGRARHRPAVQDPARPRRRHAHDRQAARFPRPTGRSASTRTAGSPPTMSPSTRAAAIRPT